MALFISDLHLSAADPKTTLEFLKFLDSPIAENATELFILGDLFARWIGDDAMGLFEYDLAYRFNEYVNQNKKIYFMPGNRDFLIGPKFFKLSQLRLLPDPSVVIVKNQEILLSHGDQLCTTDTRYLQYRKIAQASITQKLFLKLPLWLRKKIADFLQSKPQSPNHTHDPKALKYQVTELGLKQLIEKTQFSGLKIIHGHTHIPIEKIHENLNITRIVLGDWQNYPGFNYLFF